MRIKTIVRLFCVVAVFLPAPSDARISFNTSTSGMNSDLNEVCGDLTYAPEQKQTHCNSARQRKEQIEQYGETIPVWTIALATCTAACFTAEVGAGFCAVANIGAILNETAATDNLEAGVPVAALAVSQQWGTLASSTSWNLPNLGQTMAESATELHGTPESSPPANSQNPETAPDDPTGGGADSSRGGDTAGKASESNDGDSGSCVAAGFIGVRMLVMGMSIERARKDFSSNITAARNLEDLQPLADLSDTLNGGHAGADTAGRGRGVIGGTQTVSSAKSSEDQCQGQGQLQCAAAMDKGLTNFVGDPRFGKSFKKATGTNIEDFLKATNGKNIDPFKAASAAIASGTGASQSKIDQAYASLNAMTQEHVIPHLVQGTTYYGGRAPAGRKGKKEENPLEKMMGKLGSMMGDKKGKEKADVTELRFAGLQDRNPNEITKDRSVSIFTRVSFRYHQSKSKVASLPWASPYNRAIAGSHN